LLLIKPAAFRLYDFDRCTGSLSAPVTVAVPDTVVSTPWACFSPNSRYLYFSNWAKTVYQYDTQADKVSGSVQLVGEYDGFESVWGLPATPYPMGIGPDKRIYLTSGNGVNYLHTIEKPDLPNPASSSAQVVFRQQAGKACSVALHDVTGKLVLCSVASSATEHSIDLSACQSGIYVLWAGGGGHLGGEKNAGGDQVPKKA
jgi:hypothetical protein